IRVATVLSHPIVPDGCEKTCDYLKVDQGSFFSWDNIFRDIYELIDDKEDHKLEFLKEKEDFYVKHPSQFRQD
ncbi:MAG: hypothetical protein J6Z03_08690, partial [Erysipelotrichaceae bacterium]|nr:hypothetical protein [Erysipelotrichaceae bacterium]